jgi:methionine-rich copper-binding protein CopC
MTMRSAMLIAAALCLISASAEAHAFLVKADPAVGAALHNGPAVIRLEFTEAVELAFSGVEIADGKGTAVALKGPRFGDVAHKVIVADLPALTPGPYHLKWHVVSVDTHRTEGDFTFTIKP